MSATAATGLSVRARHRVGGFTLDVSLEAPPGVTVLFGPSGSGKSTTLSAVAGLVRPDEGRIALGADVWLDTAAGVAKPIHARRVAYVFQSLALFPHMTAEGNVAYGMEGKSADEKMHSARKLLERFRVGHLVGRRPATFSGGEAQRVALARAFAMAPRAVLMDEPFSALDSRLRSELLDEVKALVDDLDVPALFVTHHRGEARALGERVVVFERGVIVRTGGAEVLADD